MPTRVQPRRLNLKNRTRARGGRPAADPRRACRRKLRSCIELATCSTKSCNRLESFSNDPIGFAAGDANLYRYVGNQPTTKTDPSGLFDWDFGTINRPEEFYELSQVEQDRVLDDLDFRYGDLISESAGRNLVPSALLAGVVFNEMLDYSVYERTLELAGFGRSCGPAQLTVDEVIKHDLYPEAKTMQSMLVLSYSSSELKRMERSFIREALNDPAKNIEILARMIRNYLQILNHQVGEESDSTGNLPMRFVNKIMVMPRTRYTDFAFEVSDCAHGSSFRKHVSEDLVRAIQAMTNSGSAIVIPGGVNNHGFVQSELHVMNISGLYPFLKDRYMGPYNPHVR